MKAAFWLKACVCGVLLAGAATGVAALTLGRAQGVIFVGKPLDLRVALQADASEELQFACMGAEVFYGETQVDPSRVSVTIDDAPGAAAKGPTVRLTASALIDEPIVTVNFRVGCQQKSSKRYTLFPDVATNVVEPVPSRPAARIVAPSVDRARPEVGADTTGSKLGGERTGKPDRAAAPSSDVSTTRRAPPAAPAASSPTLASPAAPAARSKPGPKASGKSRLKLDLLDLQIEHDPVLQVTTELLTLPQENDAAARAEAAALWRSLNASPQDRLLEEAKTKALERDLRALYTVTTENQKALMDLVGKLQRAESERFANPLVYALVTLCVLLLLTLLWVWSHKRTARPTNWMQGVEGADSLMAELVKAPPVKRPVPAATASPPSPIDAAPKVPAVPEVPQSLHGELDFDLDAFAPSPQAASPVKPVVSHRAGAELLSVGAESRPVSATTQTSGRDFSVSVAGGLRAIDSAELLDVRQQAQFFMALGEHQKAIDVLTTRIAQAGESSPLVCLDLLKIYNQLGRESEYEFMRQEFNNWFTGRVPVIDDFGKEGRSLEKYPKVIDQIVALWPDPRVLEYIENCIYHHSTDVYEPEFDLLAYRELLLLHGVAKQIVRLPDAAADGHAGGLVRIAAPAPSGAPLELPGSGEVPHRVGAQHRGAWKRTPVRSASQQPDPEADLQTRGGALNAIRLPSAPVVTSRPMELMPESDGEGDHAAPPNFETFGLR